MNRSRVTRWLRISASVVCIALSACVALAWVQNLRRADVVWAPLPAAGQVTIASADGQIEFSISMPANGWPSRIAPQSPSWGWETYTASRNRPFDVFIPWKTVIRYRFIGNRNLVIILPHWLLATVPLLLAVVPWIRWSWRFTIRTLLVITTLVAVVMALAATAGE